MFKISALTDYGLVLITHMEHDGFVPIQSLVETTGLPSATLAKLASQLEKNGLLTSKEGRGGGYQLARSRDKITLREVIESLEGPIAPVRCISHPGSCSIEGECAVKPHWPGLTKSLNDWAEGFTVEDLINDT